MAGEQVRPLTDAVQALEKQAQQAAGGQAPGLLAACASRREMLRQPLPAGMRVAPYKARGHRICVQRSPNIDHNVATAYWPKDGLEETRFPILCCVLSGTAALPLGNYCIQADAGRFIFIPPSIPHPDGSRPHVGNSAEDESCDLFWLYRWEGGLICHICHSRGASHANFEAGENCFLTGEQSVLFFDLLTDAVTAWQKAAAPGGNARIPGTLRYLLPALLAAVGDDLQSGSFVQPGAPDAEELPGVRLVHTTASTDHYSAILRAQNYMAFHLARPLSIDAMAQLVCMSRAQFTRQFRRVAGHSFLEHLTALRLERAKVLLRDTDWNIELVARAVGLRPARLWDLFAKRLNVTPGEFRRGAVGSKLPPRSRKAPVVAENSLLRESQRELNR